MEIQAVNIGVPALPIRRAIAVRKKSDEIAALKIPLRVADGIQAAATGFSFRQRLASDVVDSIPETRVTAFLNADCGKEPILVNGCL